MTSNIGEDYSTRLRSSAQKKMKKPQMGKENQVNIKETPKKKSSESQSPVKKQFDTPTSRKSYRSNPLSDDENDDDQTGVTPKLSPPKRVKSDSKNHLSSPTTPSQLISRIRILTPSSASKSGGNDDKKSLTPKQLFSYADSRYDVALDALHSFIPNNLPGREFHLQTLERFLFTHLNEKKSGSLYVSGPPGTGKTACLQKVMQVPKFKAGYKMIYINCALSINSQSVYGKIAKELNINATGSEDILLRIEKHVASNHKMTLLVLDEMDQLDSKKQLVLYTLFELPAKLVSKLVLIGIANALDLTDRLLPRLQSYLDMKPELLHFSPYSKEELLNIVTDRLRESGASDIFSPSGLQYLSVKVATISGDARRAMDIGRQAILITEAQNRDKNLPLKTVTNFSNPGSPVKSPVKNEIVLPVGIDEVKHVLNEVYTTSQKLEDTKDSAFPLQQRILICTLLLILRKSKSKDVTVGKLYDVFKRVCQKRNLQALSQGEFVSLCELIEIRGIIRVIKRKESRLSKVCLEWDEEDVRETLKDKQLMSDILCDTSCLTPN